MFVFMLRGGASALTSKLLGMIFAQRQEQQVPRIRMSYMEFSGDDAVDMLMEDRDRGRVRQPNPSLFEARSLKEAKLIVNMGNGTRVARPSSSYARSGQFVLSIHLSMTKGVVHICEVVAGDRDAPIMEFLCCAQRVDAFGTMAMLETKYASHPLLSIVGRSLSNSKHGRACHVLAIDAPRSRKVARRAKAGVISKSEASEKKSK